MQPCQDGGLAKTKSIPGLDAYRMKQRPRVGHQAPNLPGTIYKFVLSPSEDAFFAGEANSRKKPFVLMHMATPKGKTQAAFPAPTTKVDVAQATPADAPSIASETTPDDSVEEVSGLIERLSIPGAAAISGEGTVERTLERALALKTEGNQHFSSGEYAEALPLYSEAIEMLEGAGEDASLATILCNRSIAYCKFNRPASALVDAGRAGALGGGKARFRLAQALSSLGLKEEALAEYEAALKNAVSLRPFDPLWIENVCCRRL